MADLSPQTTPLPLRFYAGIMSGACLLAVLGAGAVSVALGGDRLTALLSAGAVAAGSLPTFLPVLFPGRSPRGQTNFGLLVFAASIARTLLLLVIAFGFDVLRHPEPRPFWLAVLAGGAALLVSESTVAIALLASHERRIAAASPLPSA